MDHFRICTLRFIFAIVRLFAGKGGSTADWLMASRLDSSDRWAPPLAGVMYIVSICCGWLGTTSSYQQNYFSEKFSCSDVVLHNRKTAPRVQLVLKTAPRVQFISEKFFSEKNYFLISIFLLTANRTAQAVNTTLTVHLRNNYLIVDIVVCDVNGFTLLFKLALHLQLEAHMQFSRSKYISNMLMPLNGSFCVPKLK
jgi:hypothetical protein